MSTENQALALLKEVSELLAEWSLNDGPLTHKKLTNYEVRQLEHIESKVEEFIIERDETWLP